MDCYRLLTNGLITQHGTFTPSTTNLQTVNYYITVAHPITVFAQANNNNNDTGWSVNYFDRITEVKTTYFKVQPMRQAAASAAADNTAFSWYVEGY